MVARRFDEVFEVQTQRVRSHRLIRLAREGRLPLRVLARYLASVLHLLRQTEPHLTLAKQISVERGLPEVAEYFSKKFNEEKGHDTWAEADLRVLSKHLGIEVAAEPVSAVHALVEFIARLIDDDPRLYLIYVVVNEYLMVSVGPAWLSALTQGCGAPLSALTVLSRHIAADQVHTEAGLDEADRLLPASFSRDRVEEVTAQAIELLDVLFTQIAEEIEDATSLVPPRREPTGAPVTG